MFSPKFGSRIPIKCFYAKLSTSNVLMEKKISGKVAVVTASTEGIGLAVAQHLGKNGAKVVISSRKEEHVLNATEKLKNEGIEVCGTVCHVGKAEDRKHLFDFANSKYGGLDILVSNAATNPIFGSILDTTEASWDKIFDVNVKSAFFLAKEFVGRLKNGSNGSIIFISSVAGYQPLPGLGAYSVSKTALLGLTKALSTELASHNIRVNCVAPGVIKTKFSSALWSNDSIRNQALQQIPLRRIGNSEDIAGLVTFLASDEASYITGETILATGGMTSRL